MKDCNLTAVEEHFAVGLPALAEASTKCQKHFIRKRLWSKQRDLNCIPYLQSQTPIFFPV